METISNTEKARKIVEHYETRYNDTRDLQWYDLEDIALQAMQFKDEEHAKEKKQWIERACEYWEKELIFPSMSDTMKMCSQVRINMFKKAMEEL